MHKWDRTSFWWVLWLFQLVAQIALGCVGSRVKLGGWGLNLAQNVWCLANSWCPGVEVTPKHCCADSDFLLGQNTPTKKPHSYQHPQATQHLRHTGNLPFLHILWDSEPPESTCWKWNHRKSALPGYLQWFLEKKILVCLIWLDKENRSGEDDLIVSLYWIS